MIHLDTHVFVWLHHGEFWRLPEGLRSFMDGFRPMISPMVRLELAFLHEIGRLPADPITMLHALEAQVDLGIAESQYPRVAAIAAGLTWTRDPFDRLIAAHALADDVPLITKDANMLKHCAVARWGA